MSSNTVEQIKERLDLVDVISQYVKLTKAGKNYKGLSPFNKEKTPSFFVSPDRGLYHCFSSGKGGDMFTFVQEMEGVDFQGALRILAEKAGVEIRHENKESRDHRERLYEILEVAKKFFITQLKERPEVHTYITDRGLTDATIEKFELGYACDEWSALHEHLSKQGYADEDILEVGLIKKRDGKDGYYDVFRNRVMFPVNDIAGRTVAFSGRYFPKPEKDEVGGHTPPKYLNSPDTTLFSKSRILFGYDKARNAIRKNNFSILVEGQMDVVMSHQGGFPNTVAVSGTSFTEEHAALLKRLSNNVLMAFDADKAGVASSGRSAELALKQGMDVKIAVLPEGVDPADLVKEGADKWRDAVRGARHVVQFFLDLIENEESDPRKRELRVQKAVLPFVALIQNAMDQAHFVSVIAQHLGIREEPVWEELKKVGNHRIVQTPEPRPVRAGVSFAQEGIARRIATARGLIGILLWQQELTEPVIDPHTLQTTLEKALGETFHTLLSHTHDHDELVFIAEIAYGDVHDLNAEVDALLHEYAREVLRDEYDRVVKELKEAERTGDQEAVEELLQKCHDLSQELRSHAT